MGNSLQKTVEEANKEVKTEVCRDGVVVYYPEARYNNILEQLEIRKEIIEILEKMVKHLKSLAGVE